LKSCKNAIFGLHTNIDEKHGVCLNLDGQVDGSVLVSFHLHLKFNVFRLVRTCEEMQNNSSMHVAGTMVSEPSRAHLLALLALPATTS
jgi:hypothetical protein